MSIDAKCARIAMLLDRLKKYALVVNDDNFSPGTLKELKQNCTELLKESHQELEEIQKIVDSWRVWRAR